MKKGENKVLAIILFSCFFFTSSNIPNQSHVLEEKNLIETYGESLSGLMNSSWPMYCHDACHSSRSPYSTENNRGGTKWAFTAEEGGIDSSPAIANDGTIYVGGGCSLYAVNPDGTKKWQVGTGFAVSSSPAIDEDGTVYVGSWDCYFYAVNPNGTQKWRFLSGVIKSSPAIAPDGTILFGSSTSGCLFALKQNGTMKWRFNESDIEGSPAIGNNGTVYINTNSNMLDALYANNGTLKWRFTVGSFFGSPAIGDDGTIYTASHDGYLYALLPNGTMKWRSPIGWGSGHVPSIAGDGTIYIGGDELYAIYPNGTRKWSFNPGEFFDATSESQAISAEGTIYYGISDNNGVNGHIVAVNSNGTEQWREWLDNDLLWSSPAIGNDGTVYIGASLVNSTTAYGVLYAFQGKKFENPVITRPIYGMIYFLDHKICPSRFGDKTLAIGKLTFEVTHPDPSNVSRIEFWVDGVKQFEITNPPYVWTWTNQYKFTIPLIAHVIDVVAINKTSMVKYTGISVWKIF